MIPYSQMCNVCNVCNASQCSLLRFSDVNFRRKVSIFSGKVQKKNSAKYKPQETLSRLSPTQQLSEAAQAANRTEIVSPANEQYENRSNCCDITTSEQQGAQRRGSERSERYKQCSNILTYLSRRYKRYKRYTFQSKGDVTNSEQSEQHAVQ